MKLGLGENKNVLLWSKKKAGSIGRGPFGTHLGMFGGDPFIWGPFGSHLGSHFIWDPFGPVWGPILFIWGPFGSHLGAHFYLGPFGPILALAAIPYWGGYW